MLTIKCYIKIMSNEIPQIINVPSNLDNTPLIVRLPDSGKVDVRVKDELSFNYDISEDTFEIYLGYRKHALTIILLKEMNLLLVSGLKSGVYEVFGKTSILAMLGDNPERISNEIRYFSDISKYLLLSKSENITFGAEIPTFVNLVNPDSVQEEYYNLVNSKFNLLRLLLCYYPGNNFKPGFCLTIGPSETSATIIKNNEGQIIYQEQ